MTDRNDRLGDSHTLLAPAELKARIKSRVREYLERMRSNSRIPIPAEQQVLSDKYDFVFRDGFRYPNFHPEIVQHAQDMLAGRFDRQPHDVSSGIEVHDYVGHVASSQAL